jgi:DNA polymerase-3 subunit gamma/tau
LEASHFVTRGKLVPETFEGAGVPETERVRGRVLSEALSLPDLARAWQVLLKGLADTRAAPSPVQAAEMVLIRLAHASQLPSPAELVARLQDGAAAATTSSATPTATPTGTPETAAPGGVTATTPAAPRAQAGAQAEALAEAQPEPVASEPATETARDPRLESFEAVVALVRAQRETILANHLERDLHLVHFEPGRIEFRPAKAAPRNLAGQLGALLQAATGTRWMVSVSGEPGAPSLAKQKDQRKAELDEAARQHPLVQAAMEAFPGAKIVDRRDRSDDPETPKEGDERP